MWTRGISIRSTTRRSAICIRRTGSAASVRYAGSPLKYSISEERHRKGWLVVELGADGEASVEQRLLEPRRDMRRVSGYIRDIEATKERSDDYVFVTLLDDNPVLFPMEKVRAAYPNALHVERRPLAPPAAAGDGPASAADRGGARRATDPASLFEGFYREVRGTELSESKKRLFQEVCGRVLGGEEAAG